MATIKFNQELIHDIISDNVQQDLHTIKDFLRWTYSTFNRSDIYYGHGYDNAWDETIQLVLTGLQLPIDLPSDLYNSRLTQSEKNHIIKLVVTRISERVPVAYLINKAWFYGIELYVDERVIIPRSPIGSLTSEQFYSFLKTPPKRILDMCTGSGCIAIACSEIFPYAEIDAVDLSIDALNVAEINIERYNLQHRVFPIRSDLFSSLPEDQYDLIIANPPYVDSEDLADMPEEYHHEPEMALGSGDDGLYITRKILFSASDYLSDEGVLICEVGNSMVHLIEQYPEVPFQWLELQNDAVGVFALTKNDLAKYKELFIE